MESLTIIADSETVLDMMKVADVGILALLRVLEDEDVLPCKRLVVQEVLPVLGLDVELLDGLVREDVARGLDAGNVGAVIEDLKEHRTVLLPVGVFVDVQLGQHGGVELLAGHWVRLELPDVGHDVGQVEDVALLVCVWRLVRLEGE